MRRSLRQELPLQKACISQRISDPRFPYALFVICVIAPEKSMPLPIDKTIVTEPLEE
jgi:hypothetical protein